MKKIYSIPKIEIIFQINFKKNLREPKIDRLIIIKKQITEFNQILGH